MYIIDEKYVQLTIEYAGTSRHSDALNATINP